MEEQLLAPCGMNCALCVNYQAMKNDLQKQGFSKKYCTGCLPSGKICAMKVQCSLLGQGQVRFCYKCAEFPCQRLKHIDVRYRTRYHMSMIENLEFIRDHGVESFLDKEEEKWRCPECGETICCHNGLCLNCNLDTLVQNKKYRWGEQ